MDRTAAFAAAWPPSCLAPTSFHSPPRGLTSEGNLQGFELPTCSPSQPTSCSLVEATNPIRRPPRRHGREHPTPSQFSSKFSLLSHSHPLLSSPTSPPHPNASNETILALSRSPWRPHKLHFHQPWPQASDPSIDRRIPPTPTTSSATEAAHTFTGPRAVDWHRPHPLSPPATTPSSSRCEYALFFFSKPIIFLRLILLIPEPNSNTETYPRFTIVRAFQRTQFEEMPRLEHGEIADQRPKP